MKKVDRRKNITILPDTLLNLHMYTYIEHGECVGLCSNIVLLEIVSPSNHDSLLQLSVLLRMLCI